MNELSVVSVQNVSKSFLQNDGRQLMVLDDVSFSVEQNEIVFDNQAAPAPVLRFPFFKFLFHKTYTILAGRLNHLDRREIHRLKTI